MFNKYQDYVAESNIDKTSLFQNKCIGSNIIDLYKLKNCSNGNKYIPELSEDFTHLAINLDKDNNLINFAAYNPSKNLLQPGLFNERYIKHPSLIQGKSKVLFITDDFLSMLSFETISYKSIYINISKLDKLVELINNNAKAIIDLGIKFILDIDNDLIKNKLSNLISSLELNYYIYPRFNQYKTTNEFLILNKRDFTLKTIGFIKNSVINELEGYTQIDYKDYQADVGLLDVMDVLSTEELLVAQNGANYDSNITPIDLQSMDLLERAKYCWNNPVNPDTLLKTGIDGFDNFIKYFERKGILIGAIPGMSKTSFCIAIAVNMALRKKHSIFFSLEMDMDFILSKILANLSYKKDISSKPLDQEDIYIFLSEAVKVFDRQQYENLLNCIIFYQNNIEKYLHIDDFVNRKTKETSMKSIEAIRMHTEKFILENKIRPVIFIDYIQQLTVENPAKSESTDKVKLDFITNVLIDMKKKLGITMFLISSLNRESYNSVISKTSFKESGSIEYAAEYLLGMQWRGMYKRVQSLKNKGEQDMYVSLLNLMSNEVGFKELEIVAAKGRTGGEGKAVYLNFNFKENTFVTTSEECIINPNLSLSVNDNIKIAKEILTNLKNGTPIKTNDENKEQINSIKKKRR